jgi:hypothetical protein
MKAILFAVKFCFFLTAALCFSHCKKNNSIPIDRLNIVLYDKPLSVIRQHIQGRWQLIYGKGGIATTTQYYHNTFWEFNDDSVEVSDNGSVYANTIMHWNYDLGTYTNGDSTFLMKFYDKESVPWVYVVERIYNDTLILHDHASDAYFYHFIKSN